MDSLKVFADRGYVVKETAPVYYTQDMDKTAKWFEETLGWYYEIDERNAGSTRAIVGSEAVYNKNPRWL